MENEILNNFILIQIFLKMKTCEMNIYSNDGFFR